MAVAVTLDCFVLNKKLYLVFIDKDFDDIIDCWNSTHDQLNYVRKFNFCSHITKISEIDTIRYKFLISNILNSILEKNIDEMLNEDDEDVQFLHFLLKAFMYKIQKETGSIVENAKIQRINQETYNFMLNVSDSIAISKPPSKKLELKVLKGNKD